jgi:cell division protein FtsL
MSWRGAPPIQRVDNTRIVREVDPRASRDLWSLLFLIGLLLIALVLYAWPHFQIHRAALATGRLYREREQLLEHNRKLQLEKATLQNLRRIETIAARDLNLRPPTPERTIVVERAPAPDGAQVARRLTGSDGVEN